MALCINFEPGPQQAYQASRYFTEVNAELLGTCLPPVEPRQLLIIEKGSPPVPVRVWSAESSVQDELADLLPWLRQLTHDVRTLGRTADMARAMELATSWSHARPEQKNLFLELLNPAHAFTYDENAELSLGIMAGETVMLSARNIMFAKLSAGLFGLSVAGLGSLLIEQA